MMPEPPMTRLTKPRLIETAEQLTDFPYLYAVYLPIRPLKREYRKAVVGNYCMFYYVDENEKTVTVARVIYGGRDHERLLK